MVTPIPRTRPAPRIALVALVVASAWACTDHATIVEPLPPVHIALEPVADGFTSPLYLTAPPGDTDRLFVVERGGRIKIVKGDQVLATPFLDLSTEVTVGGSEQGLLSMAFHPDYASNGYFYVDYTDADSAASHVVRYTVSSDPDVADAGSASPVLSVAQPFANHNGGLLEFGPDGMLYVGLGDGGSGGDPSGNGQNTGTLLGSILRLDVDGAQPYAIPPDNPFVGQAGARGEIWAYGLRNPWRFAFDGETGDLYIADVGQNAHEEVDFERWPSAGGVNYGWNIMEGSYCYSPSSGCSMTGLTLPVYDYPHTEGCSITGGYVYRGSASPSLEGRYFFSDYCDGWIRSFTVAGSGVATAIDVQDHTDDVGTLPSVSSFGEDAAGELYVISLDGGVWRIVEE